MHDLAQNVVGKHEFSIVKVSSEMDNISEVRRLQLVLDEGRSITFPKALHNLKKLRTIVDFRSKGVLDVKSFSSNRYLRVLHLGGFYKTVSAFTIPRWIHLRYLRLSPYSTRHFLYQIHLDLSTIGSFYNLQTLVLRWCDIQSLLTNIGSLKNLRYLDVSNTGINVLPDSITSLCNLRTLKFDHCLGLNALPTDFGQLKHLRSLDLRGTKIQVLPESCTNNLTNLEVVHLGSRCMLPREIKNWMKLRYLTFNFEKRKRDDEMPRGMEKLTSLQILKPYVMRKEEVNDPERSSGIEEFHGLNLFEDLHISHLENVRGPTDAERANFKGKLSLRKLWLQWNSEIDESCSVVCDDAVVLEALQPHPNLKELVIDGFLGSKLPTWMGGGISSSSCLLINLVQLRLISCKRCEQLPVLGRLPSLRYLCISRMKSLKHMGEEMYNGNGGEFCNEGVIVVENNNNNEITDAVAAPQPVSSLFFPSLIEFELQWMESLEEWVAPPRSQINNCIASFPLLEKMTIWNCPKLTIAPISFPSLKELKLWSSNLKTLRSIARDSSLTSLTSLNIADIQELIYLPRSLLLNNSCLQNPTILYCENFQGFHDLDNDRDNISRDEDEAARSVSAETELTSCPSLQELFLKGCPVLTFVPPNLQCWTTLRRLTIENCEKLKKSLPNDRNCLSFIQHLHVDFWQNDPRTV